MSGRELRRILVVDDEPDILTVTQVALRARGGFLVETCEAARDAVATARRFEPDLILLDVMMPELDGPSVLKALREDRRTAEVPVVFMTAKVMPQETHRYSALGAAGIVAKPFDPATLAGEIRAIWRDCAEDETTGAVALQEVIEAYSERVPERLAGIEAAFARLCSGRVRGEDAEDFLRLSHRLAGTAATYGHVALGDAAARLERAAERQVVSGRELAPAARAELAELVAALREAEP